MFMGEGNQIHYLSLFWDIINFFPILIYQQTYFVSTATF